MGDSDGEDDFVFFGNSLQRVEDLKGRAKRDAPDKGLARVPPPWQQEVVDEAGRRRFHGAFTGGFSAGYFNTVGSKEGWAPSQFVSSRANRVPQRAQRPEDFMDDDEKAEATRERVAPAAGFDAFGFTAREVEGRAGGGSESTGAPGQAASAVPGGEAALESLLAPVLDSIGRQLLRKMGWREGRQLGPAHVAAGEVARREGRRAAFVLAAGAAASEGHKEDAAGAKGGHRGGEGEGPPASEAAQDHQRLLPKESLTSSGVPAAKLDLYGIGFDPYQGAEDVRAAAERRREERAGGREGGIVGAPRSAERPGRRKMAPGFGIGALEAAGEEDEDIYDQEIELDREIAVGEEEEEGGFPSLAARPRGPLPAMGLPPRQGLQALPGTRPKPRASHLGHAVLPGFQFGSRTPAQEEMKRFPPPAVPATFSARHTFPPSLGDSGARTSAQPQPLQAPPPSDAALASAIEGMAAFVARSGPEFERLAREKHRGEALFAFLEGEGEGSGYYLWRLWHHRNLLRLTGDQHAADAQGAEGEGPEGVGARARAPKLDAERRRERLGEKALAASAGATSAPSSASVAARSLVAPAQEGRAQGLSAAAAAPPPAAAPSPAAAELAALMAQRFQSAGVESSSGAKPGAAPAGASAPEGAPAPGSAPVSGRRLPEPTRTDEPWRPMPLVCKRFNVLDPYAGRAPPHPSSMRRPSQLDSFMLSGPAQQIATTAGPDILTPAAGLSQREALLSLPPPPPRPMQSAPTDAAAAGAAAAATTTATTPTTATTDTRAAALAGKPLDLFKAIFSDEESADEGDGSGPGRPEGRAGQGTQSGTASQGRALPPAPHQNQTADASAAMRALARLEAGDFLESLGEELGLEVPREAPRELPPPHAGLSAPLLGERRRPGEDRQGGREGRQAGPRDAGSSRQNDGGLGDSAGRSRGESHAGARVPPEGGVLEQPGADAHGESRGGKRSAPGGDEAEGSSSEGGSESSGDRERRRKKEKRHRRRKHGRDKSSGDRSSRQKGSKGRDRDEESDKRKTKKRTKHGEGGEEDSEGSHGGDDRRHKHRRKDRKGVEKDNKRKHSKHISRDKKPRAEGSSEDDSADNV